MTTIRFTPNLRRHVNVAEAEASGNSVGAVLEDLFLREPALRGYVLDDQGAVRKHVVVFVNGTPARDRQRLTDAVGEDDEIFVFQALSGG